MNNKCRSVFFVIAILTLTFYWHYPAQSSEATNYTFTKIADFQTGIPQGTGNFTVLGNPSISEGKVAFYGASGGLGGIYLYDYLTKQLEVVADENTLAPGGTSNFTKFEGVPSISGGNIAFFATRYGSQGIYSYIGGLLDVMADGNTWIPDGDWYFQTFDRYPSISKDRVAFTSFGIGVYTNYGGALNAVADTDTYIPGGSGKFGNFTHASISNGNIVFKGSGGVYISIGGQLDVVADLNTEIPGGTGNFMGLLNQSISGDKVIFYGEGSGGQKGIYLYTYSEDHLEVVINENTVLPSVTPSISGDKVAFKGSGPGIQSIYLFSNSSIEKIIERGDIIDGRTIVALDIGTEGLDGNQIAFRAYLNDATDGIFLANKTPSIINFSENNHWYGIFDRKADWHSAKSFCEALGGYLTTLTSNDESDYVYHSLAKNYKSFWIGATDEISEGDWQWVNGENWVYTNWAEGQPDDWHNGQDYLVFNPVCPNQWDDNGPPNDNLELDFICEWDNLDDFLNIIRKTDIDHDNDIDGQDLHLFLDAFGSVAGSPDYNPDADFDEDLDVDEINLISLAYMYGVTDLGIFLTDVATLPSIPDHNLSIMDELDTEDASHESVYARIMNLQLNVLTPEDDADHFMRNYANPHGAGLEPSGKTLITHLLDNTWNDELNIDSSFNTVYSNSPGPDGDGVFEVVSVSDDGGSIRGTNNTHSYYFSYDALNDWNNAAITINQWINYIESIRNIYGSIGRLTIFAHGNRGYLHMSDSFILTTDNLQNDSNIRNEVSRLSQILSEGSHILLFSCKVAKDGLFDNKGSEFIQELANLTGATVHANRDYTGDYNNSWFGSDSDWSLDAVAVPNN